MKERIRDNVFVDFLVDTAAFIVGIPLVFVLFYFQVPLLIVLGALITMLFAGIWFRKKSKPGDNIEE